MTAKKIKILLFIPSLTAGGAERVMLFIAKNLNKEKFEVKLIITGFEKDTIYDTSKVEVIYLNQKKVKNSFFKILNLFFIHKPDIVLGSLTHINYIIALASHIFPNTICIARETIVLSVRDAFKDAGNDFTKKKRSIFEIFDSKVSGFAHKRINFFICQSEDMRNDMVRNSKYDKGKIVTINNPVSNEIKTKSSIPDKNPIIHFITVGRLSRQKGYERIIKGLSELEIPFKYTIIGSGSEKERVFALAKQLNMLDKIIHIPTSKNVYKHLTDSHIYLQGSFYEGFPNALVESLGTGTPAVVYQAPGGMNEIIINGENGFLVKNDGEFKEKLNHLICDLDKFSPLKVSNHVLRCFNWKKIISDYEQFFESTYLNQLGN